MTGQSLACKIFHDFLLVQGNSIEVVNLSKPSLLPGGALGRMAEVFSLIAKIWRRAGTADLIYFTIAESFWGSCKDQLIYLVCGSRLNQLVIHLHGGAGMRMIMQPGAGLLRQLNRFFLSRLGGVIILGEAHADIFCDCVDKARLHIVPNFSEDYLFLEREAIVEKYEDTSLLRVLFLSNLIEGKGHSELLAAFLSLDEDTRARLRIDFAGSFGCQSEQVAFTKEISKHPQLCYHGPVSGERKKRLLSNAHIFCLPTYYAYEGQPISILEAYAAGCYVITTDHSGIRDIHQHGVNGLQVEKRSVSSLATALRDCAAKRLDLGPCALRNNTCARERFRTKHYNTALIDILNAVAMQMKPRPEI